MTIIDRLEKYAGSDIQPGRNNIKGYPVDIEDSDGSYITLKAVNIDAAKDLGKLLRKEKFKIKAKGKDITITEDMNELDDNIIAMEDVDNMIAGIRNEDQEQFDLAFRAAIGSVVTSALTERKLALTETMFKTESVEQFSEDVKWDYTFQGKKSTDTIYVKSSGSNKTIIKPANGDKMTIEAQLSKVISLGEKAKLWDTQYHTTKAKSENWDDFDQELENAGITWTS